MNYSTFVATRVAVQHGITLGQIMGRQRSVQFSHPRQLVMALLAADGKLSLAQIGREIGGRDHTTVLHAKRAVAKRLPERDLQKEAKDLRTELYVLTGTQHDKLPSREAELNDSSSVKTARELLRVAEKQRDMAVSLVRTLRAERESWKRKALKRNDDRSLIRAERAYGTVTLRNENEDLRAKVQWLESLLMERGVSRAALDGGVAVTPTGSISA